MKKFFMNTQITKKDLIDKFRTNKSYMTNGAGLLAAFFKVSKELIYEVKKEVHRLEAESDLPNLGKEYKILVLDIETAPIRAGVWKLWKQSITPSQIISDWFILGYDAKWIYSSDIISDVVTEKEAKAQDDKRLVLKLKELLDDADMVITYNGTWFDLPKINTRMLIHGILPNSPYKQIDLFKTINSTFRFSSKRLDYVLNELNLTSKVEGIDMDLWLRCIEGDKEALTELKSYNEQDVYITEKLYFKLRPWITNHPNITLYGETVDSNCGICGSEEVIPFGYTTTAVGKYPVYKCISCGGYLKGRKTTLTREENKKLLKNA
jgi:DNA polymerase elongation subunit (family B)